MTTLSHSLIFDTRYSFDIFTEYPLEQDFPFKTGERLQVPVFLVSHPVNDYVLAEISSRMVWFASVYPFGQPDPSDPFGETLLLNIQGEEQSPLTWKFPWRVDHDDILLAYLEEHGAVQQVEQAIDNPGLAGGIIMDLIKLEKMEADDKNQIHTWRMILKPAGDQHPRRIVGSVEWRPA